ACGRPDTRCSAGPARSAAGDSPRRGAPREASSSRHARASPRATAVAPAAGARPSGGPGARPPGPAWLRAATSPWPAGDPPGDRAGEAAVRDDGGVLPRPAGHHDVDVVRSGDDGQERVLVCRLHPARPVVDPPHPALLHPVEWPPRVLVHVALHIGAREAVLG